MKILLTTLNTRFVHTSLALRYLEGVLREIPDVQAERLEFTINAHIEDVLGEIYQRKAQVVAFSCYIWNISLILQLAGNLKKLAPNTIIICGGPEVSHETEDFLRQHHDIDFIITGEGEEALPKLLKPLARWLERGLTFNSLEEHLQDIGGLYWRQGNEICYSGAASLISPLDSIPSPFWEELGEFREQIAYLETTRGCPYSCGYCLSASLEGVRYFSVARIKADLGKLIAAKVKQVKFVDRTFNLNKKHALELWQYLVDEDYRLGGIKTNFHFEISGHLLDQEMINFLSQVPAGLFQFEIGVQSTNYATLKAINRTTNLPKLKENVRRLQQANNIHLHLDLIAGLPFEGLTSFAVSFNEVISLKPHRLQLGFLKLIKGTPLKEEADKYGYLYFNEPPYQVMANKFLAYEEVLLLQEVEELVEKIYNSHQFFYTMNFVLANFDDQFTFFRELITSWKNNSGKKINEVKQKELYPLVLNFCQQKMKTAEAAIVRELLKLDLLRQQRLTQLPEWADQKVIPDLSERLYRFFADEQVRNKFFPHRENLGFQKLAKQVHFELIAKEAAVAALAALNKDKLSEDIILLFDYNAAPDPLIGGARFYPVKI